MKTVIDSSLYVSETDVTWTAPGEAHNSRR
jgi:hypothetical protein